MSESFFRKRMWEKIRSGAVMKFLEVPYKHLLSGWGVCALAAVVCALIMLVLTNLPVLLNDKERAIKSISPEDAVLVENADGSSDIIFNNPEGVYINKLLFDIYDSPGEPVTVFLSVRTAAAADGISGEAPEETYICTDKNPVYVGTEVINLNKKNVTAVHIETQGSGISDFRIDNSLNKNIGALIFAALFGAALAKLILFRGKVMLRPELAFIIIAAVAGLSLVTSLPATKVGYDEETHLQAVIAMANFPNSSLSMSRETLYQLTVTAYNDPDALPGSVEETGELEYALDTLCDYDEGESTPEFSVPASRVPAYLTMALGAKLAMLAGAGWSRVIFIVRLFNLITYIALMYAAIRLLDRAKPLMMFIGLLPETLFMASTCSYDPFVIGCLSVGFALMLKGRRYTVPMLIFFILGCMPKAVYAPVILMAVPAAFSASEKSAEGLNRRAGQRRILPIALCIAIFLLLTAVFILPTVLDPADTGDIRGGDVSELSQISFIFSHPFTYAGILLSQMLAWAGKCWFGPDCFTFMGHLVNGSTEFKGYYHLYMLILAAIIILSYAGLYASRRVTRPYADSFARTEGNFPQAAGVRLDFPMRVWIFLMVMFSSALVWTAMYVAFTQPGAREIAGVQGRYFIPLMFPLYLVISGHTGPDPVPAGGTYPADTRLEHFIPLCYYLLELIGLLALAAVIWRTSTAVFCV